MNNLANVPEPAIHHQHTSRCGWNHDQAAWTCPPVSASSITADVNHPSVDVRDMLVVHTALLREFRLAPHAVARVTAGARSQAKAVDGHLSLLRDLLHHHHTGEDELLWPVLRSRLSSQAVEWLEEAQAEHAAINEALGHVCAAQSEWIALVDVDSRAGLIQTLQTLHGLLTEHLDAEERRLLPLAAALLTETEWHAVGAAGAASVPKSKLPLVFGMFAYEGDSKVLVAMLSGAPAVPRHLVPIIAPRVYARHAARVYGTPRP